MLPPGGHCCRVCRDDVESCSQGTWWADSKGTVPRMSRGSCRREEWEELPSPEGKAPSVGQDWGPGWGWIMSPIPWGADLRA